MSDLSDGKLIFKTKIDNSNIEKDLKVLERKIRSSQESISKMNNAKLPLEEQLESLTGKLETAKKNVEYFRSEMESINKAMAGGASAEDYMAAASQKPAMADALKQSEKELAALQKQWDTVNAKVEDYDNKIKAAEESIARNTEQAGELQRQLVTPDQSKMSESMAKAEKTAESFGKRIRSIAASALMFNLISKGLRSMVSYMGQALKSNSEYTAQLARLKGALLTAFQPIYTYVLPGLMSVMKVLTAIVSAVGNVLSYLFGSTLADSAKGAKALNQKATAIEAVGDAAQEAEKQLLGFDEINKLSSEDTGSSGGGGGGSTGIDPDFSEFDTEEYKNKIDELTVYLSGALLALGAILAFSGANIPLGIALMAAGAISLAAVVKENWGAMSDELKNAIATVTWLVSGALLAIGAVLAFSGTNIPLGIGLLAAGAIGLVASGSMNWDGIVSTLQGPIGRITAIVSAAALVLGALLTFSGVNIPLGMALMAAGATGLVTVGSINWNALQEKLKSVWNGIKEWFNSTVKPCLTLAYWQEKFSVISDAIGNVFSSVWEWIQNLWNEIVGFFNGFVGMWNSVFGGGGSGGSYGTTSGASAYSMMPETPITRIPALARGAVLPANKPFLAMVGDQKSGTNVEAPLETIKQALAEVLGESGLDVDINFTGSLSQLARVLTPEITKRQRQTDRAKGG